MALFCKRISDGAIYPHTPERAVKAGFEEVEIDVSSPAAGSDEVDDGSDEVDAEDVEDDSSAGSDAQPATLMAPPLRRGRPRKEQ